LSAFFKVGDGDDDDPEGIATAVNPAENSQNLLAYSPSCRNGKSAKEIGPSGLPRSKA
jgi:hypothetical protein